MAWTPKPTNTKTTYHFGGKRTTQTTHSYFSPEHQAKIAAKRQEEAAAAAARRTVSYASYQQLEDNYKRSVDEYQGSIRDTQKDYNKTISRLKTEASTSLTDQSRILKKQAADEARRVAKMRASQTAASQRVTDKQVKDLQRQAYLGEMGTQQGRSGPGSVFSSRSRPKRRIPTRSTYGGRKRPQ